MAGAGVAALSPGGSRAGSAARVSSCSRVAAAVHLGPGRGGGSQGGSLGIRMGRVGRVRTPMLQVKGRGGTAHTVLHGTHSALLAHGAAGPQGECHTAHARLCSACSPHSMHSTHLLAHGAAHRGQGQLAAKQPGVAGAQLCRVASAAGQPRQERRVGSKGMITCCSSTGTRRRCCAGRARLHCGRHKGHHHCPAVHSSSPECLGESPLLPPVRRRPPPIPICIRLPPSPHSPLCALSMRRQPRRCSSSPWAATRPAFSLANVAGQSRVRLRTSCEAGREVNKRGRAGVRRGGR